MSGPIPTRNPTRGFAGTWAAAERAADDGAAARDWPPRRGRPTDGPDAIARARAWAAAFDAIATASDATPEQVRACLDSVMGRHFAAGALGRMRLGVALEAAVQAEVELWRRAPPGLADLLAVAPFMRDDGRAE